LEAKQDACAQDVTDVKSEFCKRICIVPCAHHLIPYLYPTTYNYHDFNTGLEPVQLLVLFLPMPRNSRNQSQTHTQDDREDFDFNVSGSDGENDVAPPAPAPVLRCAVTQVVNDPETCSKSSTAAHDVWHYFEKIKNDNGEDKARCRVCMNVLSNFPSFSSLMRIQED
jgi:hypothetical protein